MLFTMHEIDNLAKLHLGQFRIGVLGGAVDERTRQTQRCLAGASAEVVEVSYDADSMRLRVGSTWHDADDYLDAFDFATRVEIVVDLTSMAPPELFFLLKAWMEGSVRRISFIYAEPRRYRLRELDRLNSRDFELTERVLGFLPVPIAWPSFRSAEANKGIFFLGFEEQRFERALEENQAIASEDCSVVFGVPAMSPGWEMHSFANNVRVLLDRHINEEPRYCGAEDPETAYKLIFRILEGLSDNESLFVVPVGTSPHGLACALACAHDREIGLLYDHANQLRECSENVGRWHLYEIAR